MSRRQQLERICEIDRQIREGLYPNADQLARQLEVSRRVIFQDREFMIYRLGAPIEFDRKHGGWFYTDQTWMLPNILVSEGELLAFFLSVEAAKRYFGSRLGEVLRSAAEKIARTMRDSVSVSLDILRQQYTFAAPALLNVDEETFLGLHRAILERRKVFMRYYTASRDEHTTRKVHPYHLYNLHGDWYLVAFDEHRKLTRSFAVSRIETWKALDEMFERDPEFSIETYMKGAFRTERGEKLHKVTVRFDAQQARYVRERQWHESQEIQDLQDGGVILRFEASGLGEVKRWVMQYGSHAEVLEPHELRFAVFDEVRRMMDCYAMTELPPAGERGKDD